MTEQNDLTTVYEGSYLRMVRRGRWEFVTRKTQRPAVGIVAITDAGKVVLVEQFRPPVGRPVIEIPAGLTGDVAGAEDEALLEAAQRELLEETGYVAKRWTEFGDGYSSPGLSDEQIVLFLAEGLTKQAPGGGDGSESITIHEIALQEVLPWLQQNKFSFDLKLLAGLYAAERHLYAVGSRRQQQGGQ